MGNGSNHEVEPTLHTFALSPRLTKAVRSDVFIPKGGDGSIEPSEPKLDATVSRDGTPEELEVFRKFDLGNLAIHGERGFAPLRRDDDEGTPGKLVPPNNQNGHGGAVLISTNN